MNIYHHHMIIMPNHLHAIIEFRRDRLTPCATVVSLPKFIAKYKSKSTVFIRKAGLIDFYWQKGFYDHIIRDHHEFSYFTDEIERNPANWQRDRLFMW